VQDRSMGKANAEKNKSETKPGSGASDAERQLRQSAALRENLLRRKQQARQRSGAGDTVSVVKKNRP
jgi:hypothetical protein